MCIEHSAGCRGWALRDSRVLRKRRRVGQPAKAIRIQELHRTASRPLGSVAMVRKATRIKCVLGVMQTRLYDDPLCGET